MTLLQFQMVVACIPETRKQERRSIRIKEGNGSQGVLCVDDISTNRDFQLNLQVQNLCFSRLLILLQGRNKDNQSHVGFGDFHVSKEDVNSISCQIS